MFDKWIKGFNHRLDVVEARLYLRDEKLKPPAPLQPTSKEPVIYPVVCQVGEWEGRSWVVINQGDDQAIGYAIWSKEHLIRLIGELQDAAEKAWPE